MKATARLYLTACATALVAAGDPRAARLYASPGDDIPDSAVEKFGLVDGNIVEGERLGDADYYGNAILRVALGQGTGLTELEVAGLTFGDEWRPFAKGEMDIAQLLAIIQHPSLTVEALQFVDDEAHQWAPIPGLDMFLPLLERQVAAAQTLGLAMPRLGEDVSTEIWALVDPTPPIDDVPPPPPPVTAETEELPVKEADAPTETKEKAPAEDKEKKGEANKAAKAKVG